MLCAGPPPLANVYGPDGCLGDGLQFQLHDPPPMLPFCPLELLVFRKGIFVLSLVVASRPGHFGAFFPQLVEFGQGLLQIGWARLAPAHFLDLSGARYAFPIAVPHVGRQRGIVAQWTSLLASSEPFDDASGVERVATPQGVQRRTTILFLLANGTALLWLWL
jgi:hypothetical protein